MRIIKAIKILKTDVMISIPDSRLSEQEAVQLGIEALERIQKHRQVRSQWDIPLLPSETER